MSLILTFIGLFLLLLCVAAIVFGVFMAMDPKNRDAGKFFVVWWIPGAAAAAGVLMRDIVTFAVGALCFLVAGAAFAFGSESYGKPVVKRTRGRRNSSGEIRRRTGKPPSARETGILDEESGPGGATSEEHPAGEERS